MIQHYLNDVLHRKNKRLWLAAAAETEVRMGRPVNLQGRTGRRIGRGVPNRGNESTLA
jgi:hypothetical protein